MMFWVDGVPAGVVAYPDGEIFTQGGDAKNIVIGSNDCDVLVYCLKVYNRRLSENEHL
jgi:hypothetical protein